MKDEIKIMLKSIKVMCHLNETCLNCDFYYKGECMFNAFPYQWKINGLSVEQYNKLKDINIDLYYTVNDADLVNMGNCTLQILPTGQLIKLDKNKRE